MEEAFRKHVEEIKKQNLTIREIFLTEKAATFFFFLSLGVLAVDLKNGLDSFLFVWFLFTSLQFVNLYNKAMIQRLASFIAIDWEEKTKKEVVETTGEL